MFARQQSTALKQRPTVPDGERIYAIGDVHGEARLLNRLLARIRRDCESRPPARVTVVILGDFIDRGPDGAALLKTFAKLDSAGIVILKGNHEDALVASYRGSDRALDFWLKFGGVATLSEPGEDGMWTEQTDDRDLMSRVQARFDEAVIDWLDDRPTNWSMGDYHFTHAGIRPGVALDKQTTQDRLWIREPFLSSRRDHGGIVVHGHTIEPGIPSLGFNRIGIDTGAHETGWLTALGLEGEEQWLLQEHEDWPSDMAVSDPVDPTSQAAIKAALFESVDRLLREIAHPEASPLGTSYQDVLQLKSQSFNIMPSPVMSVVLLGVVAIGLELMSQTNAVQHTDRPPATSAVMLASRTSKAIIADQVDPQPPAFSGSTPVVQAFVAKISFRPAREDKLSRLAVKRRSEAVVIDRISGKPL